MPPKPSSPHKTSSTDRPTKQQLEAINNYLAQKPDFAKLIEEAKAKPQPSTEQTETEYDRIVKEAVKDIREAKRRQAREETTMPVDIKDSKGAEVDENERLQQSRGSENVKDSQGQASVEHHKAAPGPVMAENLGEPASKEELKKRAEELNKKS